MISTKEWLDNYINMLEQAATNPQMFIGSEVTISNEETNQESTVTITENDCLGFSSGVVYAMSLLGEEPNQQTDVQDAQDTQS